MQNEFPLEAQAGTAAVEPETPDVPDFDATLTTEPFDCAHFLAEHMLQAAAGKANKPLPPGL